MAETIGAWFDRALACTTREEADAWLEAEVARMLADPAWVVDCLNQAQLPTAETVRQLIRSNLGYLSGYYGLDVGQRIYELFGAEHPVFGTPAMRATFSPEDTFAAGQLLGERARSAAKGASDV